MLLTHSLSYSLISYLCVSTNYVLDIFKKTLIVSFEHKQKNEAKTA